MMAMRLQRTRIVADQAVARGAGGHAAGSGQFGAMQLADKTLTSVNRRPSAPLRHGLVIVRRTERQGFQQGDQKMTNIHSFKTVAGAFSIVALASILTAAPMAAGNAAGQSALQVPQSIAYEHEQIMKELTNFAKREVAHAAAVQKALIVIKAHYAKEESFVLPPLALLPQIAKAAISKDMEPAIAMADRTKAALAELQNDHLQITSLMNELIEAGKADHDEELTKLATRVAIQSLNDVEIAQPTTILVGDYLRRRLVKGD
jgi:hypothetical protein